MTAKRIKKRQMARLLVRDMGQIDGRLHASRELVRWRSELIRDLGGDLSAQQLTLIELCVRNRLFLDSLDVYLMGLPSLVNKRKRAALPILATRMQLSDSLARLLSQLGLQRRMPEAPDLADYIRECDEAERKAAAQPEASEPATEPEGGEQ